MKEMDLREALAWCYYNPDKPLRVNNACDNLRKIRMVARDANTRDEIGFYSCRILQGKGCSDRWQYLNAWWDDLTKPGVTFSLIDDKEDKLKELENKQRALAKEQERLADEIRSRGEGMSEKMEAETLIDFYFYCRLQLEQFERKVPISVLADEYIKLQKDLKEEKEK